MHSITAVCYLAGSDIRSVSLQVLDCFFELAETSSDKRNAAVATLVAEINKQDNQASLIVRNNSPMC